MKYELAKQLKDAGFPQKDNLANSERLAQVEMYGDWAYYPTLSELIEACGERFEVLAVLHDMNLWEAGEFDGHDGGPVVDHANAYGAGSRPEEAVARLWLALNTH